MIPFVKKGGGHPNRISSTKMYHFVQVSPSQVYVVRDLHRVSRLPECIVTQVGVMLMVTSFISFSLFSPCLDSADAAL